MSSDTFDKFQAGNLLAGKLRIVRPLGAGGMGAVFEVEHELTHHRRALKLLHAEMTATPGVVERFLREASAAGRIGNPHIVETFDAGHLESGEPYIVMEVLEGKSLADLLEEQGPLSLDRACDILAQACDGVGAAHAAGIVHRDLKPENLFLTGPRRSFVKILDFGISKFDSATTGVEGLTLEGSPIGTPSYMAPEQMRGESSVDPRADVYALGVVFYECLTGQKPFVARTLPALALAIHEGKYTPASALRAGLPPEVDPVIARAVATHPEQRFTTPLDFAGELERLRRLRGPAALDETQPGQSELSRTLTPAPVARGSDPPRKHRAIGVVLIALGALVIVVGGGALYLTRPAAPEPAKSGTVAAEVPPARVLPAATALAPASPPIEVVPTPPATASAAPSTRSVNAARPPAQPRSPAGAPSTVDSASRARAMGLSEENPFR